MGVGVAELAPLKLPLVFPLNETDANFISLFISVSCNMTQHDPTTIQHPSPS